MVFDHRARAPRAWLQLVAGLFGYAAAITFMIESNLGLGPWDAFHVGLHYKTGITIGVASMVAGLGLIVLSWFIGVRPGLGTIANMFLIGIFIDLLTPLVPEAHGWLWGLAYYIPAIVICGLSTGFYIAAGLGKGPRDGTVVGLSKLTGWPVRRVRTMVELVVLLLGWLMGAQVGLGTILFALGIGPAMQWGMRVCGAEGSAPAAPRDSDPARVPAVS